jgi:hypothetical protein
MRQNGPEEFQSYSQGRISARNCLMVEREGGDGRVRWNALK